MKEEKQRRRIAVALALGILAAQWPVCPVYAVADGEEAVRGDGQYVVAAKTETALAIAEEKYDSGPLEEYTDENHMQEENITVLELTPKEAAALEDMPEIRYVEENILFEGLSDVSPVEAQEPIEKKKARLGKDWRSWLPGIRSCPPAVLGAWLRQAEPAMPPPMWPGLLPCSGQKIKTCRRILCGS